MLLSLTPVGGDEFVVIAEDATSDPHGFVLQAQDWGNAAWEHQFSGPRGTQGARPSQGTPVNRTVRLQFRLYGASTDDLAARVAELELVMEALRRRGGTITRRAHGQTYRQHFEVLTTNGLQAGEWLPVADTRYILSPILEFVCAPYALGDPMAWTDVFSDAAAVDGYEVAAGTASALSVSGGLLHVASSVEHLLVDARRGYRYGDVEVSARIWPGSPAPGPGGPPRRWGVLLRYVDTATWLAATVEQVDAVTPVLCLRSCIGGVQTVISSVPLTNSLPGLSNIGGWIRGRVAGPSVLIQWTSGTTPPPSPWPSGAEYVTSSIPDSHLAAFGPGTDGRVGLYAVPQDGAGVGGWHTLRVQPLVSLGNGATPMHRTAFPLRCDIPGTAPALADITVTRDDASIGGAPRFALIAWAPHKSGWNRCTNGSFGDTAPSTIWWTKDAVPGVTAAAADITASPGDGHAAISLATTPLSGVAFGLGSEFKGGHRYRARCEVRTNAGSPTLELVIGCSGDLADSANQAPSSDWSTLEVDWTPGDDVYGAPYPYVAVRATGATGGAFWLRNVEVFEAEDEPTVPSQQEGRGAPPPLGVHALGATGFLVAASSGGTLTYTDSGVSALVPTAVNMATSGPGELAVSALLDPNLAGPDDYADGSLDVEVWARLAVQASVAGPRCAVWASHPAAAYDTDDLGGRRAMPPWGLAGKPLKSVAGYWRLVRLGVITVDVNPGNMAPWRLTARISWGAGSTGNVHIGALITVPARARALTPTGVVLSEGGYPQFIGSAGGDGRTVVKRIHSDGSGAVSAPPIPGRFADHGLGGSLLELPTGPVDMLAVFADQVPDDPAPAAAHVQHPSRLAIAVSPTPRWGHLRDI